MTEPGGSFWGGRAVRVVTCSLNSRNSYKGSTAIAVPDEYMSLLKALQHGSLRRGGGRGSGELDLKVQRLKERRGDDAQKR